jgi:hypothetical protein
MRLIALCVISLGRQDVQLPFQRMYAVINIVKGIHRRFGEGVESKLIKLEARQIFLSYFKGPSSQDQQKNHKVALTMQSKSPLKLLRGEEGMAWYSSRPMPSLLAGLDSSPLFCLHNSIFSIEQGLRPHGKISSCYTFGFYLRTLGLEQHVVMSRILTTRCRDLSFSGVVLVFFKITRYRLAMRNTPCFCQKFLKYENTVCHHVEILVNTRETTRYRMDFR